MNSRKRKRRIEKNKKRKELTRLVLVFSLNLQDIEKVGRGSVHLDEILVLFGHGIGQIFYNELCRAL